MSDISDMVFSAPLSRIMIVSCAKCEFRLKKYLFDLDGDPYQNNYCPVCGGKLKQH